ncbi:MAG: CotH kinase family protein [Eubacteriales bacterium]|nr:CotH kinase family protein [Eubacteriales bacterium]
MKRILLALLATACLLLAGCARQQTAAPSATAAPQTVSKAETMKIADLPLTDDSSLYGEFDPTDVVCFYLTVIKGSKADGTDHTFDEVNAYRNTQDMSNVQKILTTVLFQVGDENGPLPGAVGYGASTANATLNVRGRTSTGYVQKSYRISLYDSAGLWQGQRAIAINKHPGDPTRLRNMLFFTLLREVPGMTSLRTRFVHVYIKDETAAEPEAEFTDYGLYTQVELPNGRYLRNHGLSQNGDLYKANICEMRRYEDTLRLATDPEYDLTAFSEILEPKTGENHDKLLEMLDAVNDYTLPIEEVIDRYFNLDNLTSYLAFNILMANPDSNAQNYLLYSPVNSDKWYYICWDGDGSLSYSEDEILGNTWTEGEWTRGVSDYWNVVLFNRMLRVEAYREALNDKVEALHKIITPAKIADLIRQYREVVDQYTTRLPDSVYMQVPSATLEKVYAQLPYDTDTAYQYYLDSVKKPMPFFLSNVTAGDGGLALDWNASFDFNGEFIAYDVQIANDWTFNAASIVWESNDLLGTGATAPRLPAGTYYWRVTAENDSGNTQTAFDQVETATGVHTGMRTFTVQADGTVVNPV